jgi:transposase
LSAPLAKRFRRLRLIWADGAYGGELEIWARGLRKWGKVRLEIVRKPKGQKGFAVLPWRWRVERTFAWLCRNRRLRCDYERLPQTHGSTHLRCYDSPDDTSARRLVSLFKLPLTPVNRSIDAQHPICNELTPIARARHPVRDPDDPESHTATEASRMEPAATQIVSSNQSRNNLASQVFLPTEFAEIETRESNSVPIRGYLRPLGLAMCPIEEGTRTVKTHNY